MTNSGRALFFSAGVALALSCAASASAQVRYAPPASEQFYLVSPYDESYGTSPSFEILPRAYGGPAVRVIERCQYPNGWNVTDFGRDVNGIPNGIDHTCPASSYGDRVRARY